MMADDCVVFVVDDDERIREALGELLASHDMRAITFGSAGDYERADKPDVPSCLILDVELPDINGLDLQRQIAEAEHPPIVFKIGIASCRERVYQKVLISFVAVSLKKKKNTKSNIKRI